MSQPEAVRPVDYLLAPSTTARFVGLAVVALALVMFAGTAVAAIADLDPLLLVVLLVLGLVAVFTLGWYLRYRAWVLRCTEVGYRVRMVRGAGVTAARWTEVEDAVTATRLGVACVVLQLRDGGTTTIPVGVLAVDRETFVRQLRTRLQQASGLRPWSGGGAASPSDAADSSGPSAAL